MHVKFDHCVVHVSDWARSDAFYRDVLGAELIEQPPNRYSYRFGDCQLNLHGPGVVAERWLPNLYSLVTATFASNGRVRWPRRLATSKAMASQLNWGRWHAGAHGAEACQCISGIRMAPFWSSSSIPDH